MLPEDLACCQRTPHGRVWCYWSSARNGYEMHCEVDVKLQMFFMSQAALSQAALRGCMIKCICGHAAYVKALHTYGLHCSRGHWVAVGSGYVHIILNAQCLLAIIKGCALVAGPVS
jgi:hypothetical protein